MMLDVLETRNSYKAIVGNTIYHVRCVRFRSCCREPSPREIQRM